VISVNPLFLCHLPAGRQVCVPASRRVLKNSEDVTLSGVEACSMSQNAGFDFAQPDERTWFTKFFSNLLDLTANDPHHQLVIACTVLFFPSFSSP
jgi:hypothetical protein